MRQVASKSGLIFIIYIIGQSGDTVLNLFTMLYSGKEQLVIIQKIKKEDTSQKNKAKKYNNSAHM